MVVIGLANKILPICMFVIREVKCKESDERKLTTDYVSQNNTVQQCGVADKISRFNEPKFVETWIQCFVDQARTKKIKDSKARG